MNISVPFRKSGLLVLVVLLLSLAGCNRTLPVLNINEHQVAISADQDGEAVIKSAILAGGAAKGWRMTESEPGHIQADITVRQHMASVDIFYDDHSYSIAYKDSQNLMYDGNKIHRNYNKWITLLDQQIALNLP
ncbi:MAG: hypothetical protein OQK99_10930 [Gammaproteobacteria bacterium]|nr:hypothetical protein [Gammaproteobacteria bacterium]